MRTTCASSCAHRHIGQDLQHVYKMTMYIIGLTLFLTLYYTAFIRDHKCSWDAAMQPCYLNLYQRHMASAIVGQLATLCRPPETSLSTTSTLGLAVKCGNIFSHMPRQAIRIKHTHESRCLGVVTYLPCHLNVWELLLLADWIYADCCVQYQLLMTTLGLLTFRQYSSWGLLGITK